MTTTNLTSVCSDVLDLARTHSDRLYRYSAENTHDSFRLYDRFTGLIFSSKNRELAEQIPFGDLYSRFDTIIGGIWDDHRISHIYLRSIAGKNTQLADFLDAKLDQMQMDKDLFPKFDEAGLNELKKFLQSNPDSRLPSYWEQQDFFYAACIADFELFKLLITYYEKHNLDLNKKFNSVGFKYFSVVQLACQAPTLDSLKLLHERQLSFEQEIDAFSEEGTKAKNFALKEAILYDNVDAAKYIIDNKLHTDFNDPTTDMPLIYIACEQCSEEMVKLLLEREPTLLNQVNSKSGDTPIQTALRFRNMEVAKYLCEKENIDLKVMDELSNTLLHLYLCPMGRDEDALLKIDFAFIQLLAQRGVKDQPNAANQYALGKWLTAFSRLEDHNKEFCLNKAEELVTTLQPSSETRRAIFSNTVFDRFAFKALLTGVDLNTFIRLKGSATNYDFIQEVNFIKEKDLLDFYLVLLSKGLDVANLHTGHFFSIFLTLFFLASDEELQQLTTRQGYAFLKLEESGNSLMHHICTSLKFDSNNFETSYRKIVKAFKYKLNSWLLNKDGALPIFSLKIANKNSENLVKNNFIANMLKAEDQLKDFVNYLEQCPGEIETNRQRLVDFMKGLLDKTTKQSTIELINRAIEILDVKKKK